ncbi:uncharacterized protein, partial [Littorina saxatilis]|uniref:uncharacterized protein n=1 Tax=Littorina saxatilis TaxID=31220 RepID=UPI0038B5972D
MLMNRFLYESYRVIYGTKFLCSVLVAPVKNENGEIIMFIINYEDITESASKNDIKKFQNNRHQSFKLRLPSIRRDIRYKARAIDKLPDPENPPIPEEAVPLSHMGSEDGFGGDRDGVSGSQGYGLDDRLGGEESPSDRLIDTDDPSMPRWGEEGDRLEDDRDEGDSVTCAACQKKEKNDPHK